MENKKEFNLEEAFAMWRQEGKQGHYFSGKAGSIKLLGFYNGKKKNPKEPDIRIYPCDADGNIEKDPVCSLWVNTSKKGTRYLSGTYIGKKVTGFINSDTKGDKRPYFRVYFQEEAKQPEPILKGTEVNTEDVPF